MVKPLLTKRNEVFNHNAQREIVSSRYDLSKVSSGSFRLGCLYPIYCRNDITPGDQFRINASPFLRFMPMVSPALVNVDIHLRYFFVPYRLLWNQWKPFISPNTSEQVNLLEPYIPNYTNYSSSKAKVTRFWNVMESIYDYMGAAVVPPEMHTMTGLEIQPYDNSDALYNVYGYSSLFMEWNGVLSSPKKYSAYPYLAYNFIWNEYFRDENLDNYAPYTVDDGYLERAPHDFFIRRVNWDKDYFSSATPFVTQAVFGSAPTISSGDTIEELREASALTRWLEMQVVGGHRYQESILSHFGVRVPDEAAQIPIYLGGFSSPMQVQSVEQNAPESAGSGPLATLGGKATCSDGNYIDTVTFKEHGVLLGLMYARPRAVYGDVNPRDLLRKTSRHDYYWPEFANLGDEAILKDEINGGWSTQSGDFGYQMRYASMRTSFDSVHGLIRPGAPLQHWTMARKWSEYNNGEFGSISSISRDFISCRPSLRVFASEEDADGQIVGDVATFVDAVRPLPNYVNPKID